MNILKEEIDREINRIKEKLEKAINLTEVDLRIILLSKLIEEDIHEGKQ